MEKRVLLTELVDRGTHLRKEITPTATITDNGKYPAGTFWDANKTLNEIVAGATDAQDTLKEVEDKLNKEISDARKAEQDIKDQIDDILGIDAQDIADLKQIVEDLDPETGILSVIDAKANTADISVAVDNTNGHAYVDLGLPSGTLWATMNIGASKETDYGEYYMYGKTTSYNGSDNTYDGTEDPLSLSADVARVNWGGDWHIPTKDQFEELIANTNYSWQSNFKGSDINGAKFTSKIDDSKYIFLPAAGMLVPNNNRYNHGTLGMYGSNTPVEGDTNVNYWAIFGHSSNAFMNPNVSANSRNLGSSIRPVIDSIHTTPVLGKTATDNEKAAWNSKVDFSDLGTAAYKNIATSGNASNTQVVMGNDTRLTDARTPLSHIHSYDSLTDKPDLSLKANVADISISVDNTNGHDYVDLGLPSGTLWAKMNVGASSETDYGNYYKYGLGAAQYSSSQTDYTGTEDPLSESLDTVAQAWGGNWRMPTKTECEELIGNTNFSWTTINGINGGKFTSKTDSSKYIFLPAGGNASAGLVWGIGKSCNYRTSTPMDSTYAYILIFSYYSSNANILGSFRSDGYSVRGVISNAVTTVLGKTVTDAEKSAWNAKADASNYYTKAEIDLMLANL